MGASTTVYTITPITVMGNKRVHKVKCAVSSYGTDGISLTAAQCGLSVIDAIIGAVLRTAVANGPVEFVWNETSKLLLAHKSSNTGTDATTVFDVDVTVMGS